MGTIVPFLTPGGNLAVEAGAFSNNNHYLAHGFGMLIKGGSRENS